MSKQAPNFVKPSGVELYVSPESQEYAKSLGWKPIGEKPVVTTAKKAATSKAK